MASQTENRKSTTDLKYDPERTHKRAVGSASNVASYRTGQDNKARAVSAVNRRPRQGTNLSTEAEMLNKMNGLTSHQNIGYHTGKNANQTKETDPTAASSSNEVTLNSFRLN